MHDAANDVNAINHDFALAGIPPLGSSKVFDSQRIARQMFPGGPLSLDNLCDIVGVDRTARERGHTALLDATLLAECGLHLAKMDGYAGIQQAGMRTRAVRHIDGTAQKISVDRKATVRISEDGKTVSFVLADGTALSVAVPPFPETHRIVAHEKSGSLLVLPSVPLEVDWTPRMMQQPDNPDGPAVMICRGGQIESLWFSR